MWIARDKCGDLYIHTTKPIKIDVKLDSSFFISPKFEMISNELFPEVTWENSPRKLVLK